ncbi:TPA: hypothetical protein NI644_004617 [Pseudomonas aeruginosa]|uniref:hypothetical protein n=1 Tax=Pseudomonas aeruginosa TaxID=287 RepID=UPI001A282C72|nr:hypothetical protein [Pseudomonas aeruginosa]MBG6882032.1 hypothetical protein [Pseudomonas aeruginosa]MBI7359807.1 hypothetical protein [Pseudomonas aeruginosa]HCF7269615.1 hypothetical protein [Pseudomonas aeruginosa]HCF9267187.1 hypothetical protein [Pseudomonas aeruginosa]HCF9273331.1 hypothetical protein [Pseudomonas aeruginosa]
MSKFKAGDLAMIISCQLVPELIGKTVELVMPVLPGDEANHGGRDWRNQTDRPAWVVAAEGLYVLTIKGNLEPDQYTLMPDHKLMPLRGDFQPEQQKSREVEV